MEAQAIQEAAPPSSPFPFDTSQLDWTPRILGNLGPTWLHEHGCDRTALAKLPGWSRTVNRALDLTLGTELEAIAEAMSSLIVQDYERLKARTSKACSLLKVNDHAVFGLVRAGQVTPNHQHAFGVFHVADDEKTWDMWRAAAKIIDETPEFTIVMRAGDVLWIPPGTWHRVTASTVSPIIAHWIVFVQPPHLDTLSLLNFASGAVGEDGRTSGRSASKDLIQKLQLALQVRGAAATEASATSGAAATEATAEAADATPLAEPQAQRPKRKASASTMTR